MSDNLQKRPSKGILKNSSSFDKHEAPQKKQKAKATQWDEMNIIATLHPADKDYGHMKIEEPKTPYNWDDVEGGAAAAATRHDELDAAELADMIAKSKDKPAKALAESGSSSSEEDESETPEERAKRKLFESKRRAHYNEGHAIKLARKLIEDEDETPDEKKEQLSCGSSPGKN